jgi:hypothetical protein
VEGVDGELRVQFATIRVTNPAYARGRAHAPAFLHTITAPTRDPEDIVGAKARTRLRLLEGAHKNAEEVDDEDDDEDDDVGEDEEGEIDEEGVDEGEGGNGDDDENGEEIAQEVQEETVAAAGSHINSDGASSYSSAAAGLTLASDDEEGSTTTAEKETPDSTVRALGDTFARATARDEGTEQSSMGVA